MFSIRLSRLPIVAVVLAALPVQAADYTDTARVVSSTPIIERVREPRQECSTEAPPPRAPPPPPSRPLAAAAEAA